MLLDPAPRLTQLLLATSFDEAMAVEYLQLRHGLAVSAATLKKLRSAGGGPAFYKNPISRAVRYMAGDLDAWALANLGERYLRSGQLADEAA